MQVTKLYELKLFGINQQGARMSAVDTISASSTGENAQYMYSFICTYGRWNPYGPDYSPLSD